MLDAKKSEEEERANVTDIGDDLSRSRLIWWVLESGGSWTKCII